jgi:hypothetical protein
MRKRTTIMILGLWFAWELPGEARGLAGEDPGEARGLAGEDPGEARGLAGEDPGEARGLADDDHPPRAMPAHLHSAEPA